MPLSDVLRKQTFLFFLKKKQERKKEICIKGIRQIQKQLTPKKHLGKFYSFGKLSSKEIQLQDSNKLRRLNVNQTTSPSGEN